MSLRVIIADDERVSRQRLARLLRKEPGVEIVAECVGGRDAAKAIEALRPDIAFLDVKMPDITGIDVALSRPSGPCAIVFVTAYDDYATRAFELDAADYLVKPVDSDRLRQTVARVRGRLASVQEDGADLRDLLSSLSERITRLQSGNMPAPSDRVAVRVAGVLRVFQTSDIDWIGTDGNYVGLHVGAAKYLIRSTASDFEAQLDPNRFVRTHRQFIVNIDKVREVHPWFNGDAVIVMATGAKVKLARTYREKFHAMLAIGEPSNREIDRATPQT